MKAAKATKAVTKTSVFDVADYLRTPEERAEYLNAWLEDAPDDVAGYARALGDVARAHGMAKVAHDTGLSRESLYKALSEKGNPSFATVLKVVNALRLSVRLDASTPAVVMLKKRSTSKAVKDASAVLRRVLKAKQQPRTPVAGVPPRTAAKKRRSALVGAK